MEQTDGAPVRGATAGPAGTTPPPAPLPARDGFVLERSNSLGMGTPPESRRQQLVKLCWTTIYLLYMAGPVGNLLDGHHTVVADVLGWIALAAFVLPYLYLVVSRRPRLPGDRYHYVVIGWLYLLAGVCTLTLGAPWLVFFVYVTICVGVMLPFRQAVWSVLAVAGTLLGMGRLVGTDGVSLATLFLPALLGGGAMMGVAQMGRTMTELRDARRTVAELAANEERLRLARDLHDLLGHSLSLIVLKSELAGRMLPGRPEDAAQQIADIERVGRQALVDVREAVSGCRRPTLAVEMAGVRTALRTAGIRAEIAPALDQPVRTLHPGLGDEEEAVLAWALREAVTNVVRHSGAERCEILLDEVWEADESRCLRLEVSDDGRGPGRGHRPGNGLSGLEERLVLSGGVLRTGRSARDGFSVSALVPLRPVRPVETAEASCPQG